MNVLITGGAGFIGSHVAEKLLAQGHRVLIIDNLASGQISNLPTHERLSYHHGNILDLIHEEWSYPIDAVAHLAAEASVHKSWLEPIQCHDVNLTGTLTLLEFCRQQGINRLVLASSAAVYGCGETLPISEQSPTCPSSPYGLQKLVSEQYGQLMAQQHGFSFVALRFFNVYGPRQNPTSPYSGVISRFMDAMAHGKPITIFGDGKQTRDFVFVEDVAAAVCQALQCPLSSGQSLACNIGSGRQTSLLNLIDVMASLLPDWKRHIDFLPTRPGDIQHSLAQVNRAKDALDWEATWSLTDGLKKYVATLVNARGKPDFISA